MNHINKTIIYRKEYKENMEIIQVTQFASSKEFENSDFDTLTDNTIVGKQEICDVIGSGFIRKTVKEDDEPYIGSVWYKKGSDGKCEYYKAHYDSSD